MLLHTAQPEEAMIPHQVLSQVADQHAADWRHGAQGSAVSATLVFTSLELGSTSPFEVVAADGLLLHGLFQVVPASAGELAEHRLLAHGAADVLFLEEGGVEMTL